ncbi:hypothetical protein TSAR_016924, partial [Trichomalopsis sarcophagae]
MNVGRHFRAPRDQRPSDAFSLQMAAGEATLHLPRTAEVRQGKNPSPESQRSLPKPSELAQLSILLIYELKTTKCFDSLWKTGKPVQAILQSQ